MPKWSEVPWGTVVIGLMAVYGAVLSTVTFRTQRARDRLARREARGGQAEQIAAWLVQYDGPQEPPYRQYLGLMLQNRSSQPIYYLIPSIVSLAGVVVEPRLAIRARASSAPSWLISHREKLRPGSNFLAG